jgi:hypothetical protein
MKINLIAIVLTLGSHLGETKPRLEVRLTYAGLRNAEFILTVCPYLSGKERLPGLTILSEQMFKILTHYPEESNFKQLLTTLYSFSQKESASLNLPGWS